MKPRQHNIIRFLTICLAPAIAGVSLPSASAASASWSATPTNGNWEAAAGETNWSTGDGPFPGSTTAASTDVATFSANTATSAISINATVPNTSTLNIGGIIFTDPALATNYVIGSTTGNSLTVTSNPDAGSTTNQIAISGAGRGTAAASTPITETVSAPIVIAPLAVAVAAGGGFYTFQNASTTATAVASSDVLVFNGGISAGTTTSTMQLQLTGANTNAGNALNGAITAGGAAGGIAILKSGIGSWKSTANNTLGSNVAIVNGTAVTAAVTVTGGTLTLSGNNTITASGTNNGNGSLINVQGTNSTLVLSGTNTLTPASTTGGAITIGAGGILSLNSFANNLGGLTATAARINMGSSAAPNSGRVIYTGTGETTAFSFGTTSSNAAAFGIIDQSGTGVLTITGAASFANTAGQRLQLQGSTAGTGDYQGVISGSTGLTKTGTGTWTLSGTNTYSGATTVSGGILKLSATGSIANSSTITNNGTFDTSAVAGYTLGATQTLKGTGTFVGNVTIAGILAVGNSPGVSLFSNDLTLTGTAQMELGGLVSGTSYDHLNVTGTLTLGGGLDIISFGGFNLAQAAAYDLFDATTVAGDFASVSVGGVPLAYSAPTDSWNLTSGLTTYTFAESTGILTVIPEPASATLGLAGMLLMLYRRRSQEA